MSKLPWCSSDLQACTSGQSTSGRQTSYVKSTGQGVNCGCHAECAKQAEHLRHQSKNSCSRANPLGFCLWQVKVAHMRVSRLMGRLNMEYR